MLNRAFIHRRRFIDLGRWQSAAFIFVLGITFYFAGNSVFEQTTLAQFRASSSLAMRSSSSAVSDQVSATSQQFGGDPGTPEIPDQHRKPATITPVEPIAPKTGPITPRIDQSIRNEIVEKHSEQLKSQDCSRKLEERRRALRQQRRAGGRNQR